MKSKVLSFIKAILNTYAILFFSQNKALGAILLLVSFLNPAAGLSGLCCVLISIVLTWQMGYERLTIRAGIYSFNSLLLGLAFGAFYSVNLAYLVWLFFACLLVILLTVTLAGYLGKSGLPILSLPFIICFWLVLLGANNAFNTGLLQKSLSLMDETTDGSNILAGLNHSLSANLPVLLSLFFRALSAVLFQNNILSGLLISVGILVHSRIAFSLLIIGFVSVTGLNAITNIYPGGISYYHLGANFMLTTVAIGSFFLIPSYRSYLTAILCIPIVFILVNAFTGIFAYWYLPVFSLPFCAINIMFIYFLLQRKAPGELQLVPLQHYSPERNLYQTINQKHRLDGLKYFPLHLPFMGSWTVSQGYDGDITHKADWGKALDFVIEDENNHTFQNPGTLPEHFYCFNKPVLACGDGVVANLAEQVEDNMIGEVNTRDNWGNTVVIKHLDGLYSKVSHLKKGSVIVKTGDTVKQGDQLALCGNSGRSPEPHLHFQLQTTSSIDAKTLAYPFSYFIGNGKLNSFNTPTEGELITPPDISKIIKKAFDFQPGYTVKISSSQGEEETIGVYTDEFNQSYIYSKETGAVAYFVNDGTLFYFTSFYGDKGSLLYYFYLSAYKIIFSNNKNILADDIYPIQLTGNKIQRWLQDFTAPFYRFISLGYQSSSLVQDGGVTIQATGFKQVFNSKKQEMEATIFLTNKGIQVFTMNLAGRHIQVQWVNESIY